ncbi:MAG: hypothetical protein ACHQAZ_01540 [Gammaproteobacteria bacterium]
MEYDKKIIEQFADKLYKRANSTIITYAFLGVLVGLFLGLAAFGVTKSGLLFLLSLVVSGFIGYAIGSDKAFNLKFQAQSALCLAEIETNTRKT